MMEKPSHVYGPVPSRRLGRSLGVDLVPYKTCSYDCIYCQLGRTTNKTVERRQYVPAQDVLDEIRRSLEKGIRPDYITLSGSGEPTLHSRLAEIIADIKGMTDAPIAVLTNGSLFWQDEVLRDVMEADLIIPSLDAGDAALFTYVNRPHEAVSFDRMVRGLVALRQAFPGQIWLEVMLLAGVTGLDAEVAKIKSLAADIQPDRVQLNTAVRPTAEDFAFALSAEELNRLARSMGPEVEVISAFRGSEGAQQSRATREVVLGLLARRPCTLSDVASALTLHPNEAAKYLTELERDGLLLLRRQRDAIYYSVRKRASETPPSESNG
jgi:wyosine [tRNA(Phe)-imidazoG37] synthetase (radical SAM superfamily)